MPTNFPASDDVFSVPSTPASVPLGNPGDSTRKHSQSHGDLGDAIEAMQGEATLLVHSHDGVTFRHGSKLSQANTHESPDTDSGPTSIHHTIGVTANTYAAGNHTHAAVTTYPVGAFFFAVVATNPSDLGVAGVWTSVGQRFLCASGGALGLTAGATGGSNSHSHTIDASTNTLSAHDHTLTSATTGSDGGHNHTGSTVTADGASHTHPYSSAAAQLGATDIPSGSSDWADQSHTHSSSSNDASHSHTASSVTSVSDHTHTVSVTTVGTGGSHSHTNSTPSTTNNLVPLLVVYMWKRTS